MKTRLTDRFVQGVHDDGRWGEFWDTVVGGLCLRVSKTGVKSWSLRKRWRGKNRRWKLGRYPAVTPKMARARAQEHLSNLELGDDPEAAEARGLTVADLIERFDEAHVRQLKSAKEVRRIFSTYVIPHWGSRPAEEITRREVHELLDKLASSAPVMSNRVRSWLSALYNWATEREIVPASPVTGIRKRREKPRDRTLSDGELGRLWQDWAECEMNLTTVAAMRCLLATGQRPGEIVRMEKKQIEGNWWTQPPNWNKTRSSHRVPLGPLALRQIEACAHLEGRYVFPSMTGKGTLGRCTLSQAARRMRKRLDFSWTPHDLRRTVATWMGSQGFGRVVIQRVLNHKDSSITAIYDRHRYEDEAFEAVMAWNQHLLQLTS